MDQCKLTIDLFTQDGSLERIVRGLQQLEQFSLAVARWDEWPASRQPLESGLIIWDLGGGVRPRALRDATGSRTAIVYCAERRALDEFGQNDLEAADEFWERPIQYPLARVRLLRLLGQIKRDRDLFLTQAFLETSINNTPDMVWFKSLDGIHVKVNRAFCAMVGKSREEVTGRDHCSIWGVSQDDPNSGEAECRATEEAVIRAGRTLQFTEHVKSPRGMRQLTTYKSPLYDRDGSILGTVGLGHDVTDLQNLSAELEILLQSMPYAILLRDNQDSIQNVNQKFEEYFGVKKEQIAGVRYESWSANVFAEGRGVNNEGFVEAAIRPPNAAGRMLELHEETIYDIFRNVVGKLCIFRDVTMERELEARILRNSNTDFMTGLYNRRSLYQYAHNNCRGKTVSMLYVDLDNFKAVNDTYGHKVGDDALILTAGQLRDSFPGDFVARIGGDEFLIVKIGCRELSALEDEALRLLKRLRAAYDASMHLGELSASIGVAQNTAQEFDIDLLIQQSDAALYRAKQSGKSCCCVFYTKKTERGGACPCRKEDGETRPAAGGGLTETR